MIEIMYSSLDIKKKIKIAFYHYTLLLYFTINIVIIIWIL